MRKIYSLVLMAAALLVGTNAWAETRTAGTFQQLQDALSVADNGDVIELTDNINYGVVLAENSLNITKSITLDGQNHTLKGASQRQSGNSNYAAIWINQGGSQTVNVTIKNITIINERTDGAYNNKGIETRGNIGKVTLDNVSITSKTSAFQVGGNQSTKATFELNNCYLHTTVYYPICSFNPYDMTITNSVVEGWCAFYFKPAYTSTGEFQNAAGSRGSSVVATNCTFNTTNIYDSESNGFGTFVLEDDGISITLNNCATNSIMLGNQQQDVLVLSGWAKKAKTNRSQPVSLTINGDNSYINGSLLSHYWASGVWYNSSAKGAMDPSIIPDTDPLTITITGGTYPFNPEEASWVKRYEQGMTPEQTYDPSNIKYVTIPSGYEVKEITTTQGTETTTLYRVRSVITTTNDINDNVEGEGDGLNENTEFIISGSTTDQTLTVDSVVAHYVEVSDNATLTIPEGKVLEVTNGLDVTDGATLVVESGSTLKVGEGGVTSENSESIVIEANESGSASFLLSPDVIVNTNPVLTVRMYADAGKYSEDSYRWHRFAMPVQGITSWTKEDKDGNPYTVPTYLQRWDYNADAWASCTVGEMIPFLGYALTYDFTAETDAAKVTYIFKGSLCGNQDQQIHFQDRGFNFFGNSYTAYVDARTLLQGVIDDENVGGTVYLWDAANQRYSEVTIKEYRENYGGLEPYEKEIAPMNTFILQKRGVNDPNVEVNYREAIWNNPRYGNAPASAPARVQSTDNASVRINVTSVSGDNDRVKLYQNSEYTDAFDNGSDATKFMNEKHINLYVTVEDEDLASVATDNLIGKALSLQTMNDVDYTMSFSRVNGTQYAIRDLMTNVVTPMTEGNTYSFVAQPNSTIEGRFVIVPMQNMPTNVETVETTTAVKGIYTIMGQYVGETSDWETLPKGVYVVDGVKVVK